MAHAVLNLRVAQSIASHSDKLLRPQVDNIRHFAGGHDDSTRQCEAVILKELVLLEAALEQDFRVVSDYVWLALSVQRTHSLRAQIADLISAEKDALAVEVCQDIIRADELHPPVKRVEDISLLSNELIVCEGDANVLEQLLDAWVGHLVILG